MIIIQAENLSKKYTIGHQSTPERYTALRDVIMQGAGNFYRKTKSMATGKPIIQGDTRQEHTSEYLKPYHRTLRRARDDQGRGREGDYWVAVCLENGVVSQEFTKEDALTKMKDAIAFMESAFSDDPSLFSSPIAINELHEFLTVEGREPTLETYELRAVYA